MLTVVIPVFNTNDFFLNVCVGHIAEQAPTYKVKVLIVDDGSTDENTKEALAVNYHFLNKEMIENEVLCFEHAGLGPTMNWAARHVETEWLLKLDSDDIAEPNLLEKMIEAIKKYPDADVIGCQLNPFGYFVFPPQIHPEQVTREYAASVTDHWIMNHTGVLIRTETLREIPYQHRPGMAEDYELWVNFILEGKKLYNLPDTLIQYRTHKQSLNALQNKEENLRFKEQQRDRLRRLI